MDVPRFVNTSALEELVQISIFIANSYEESDFFVCGADVRLSIHGHGLTTCHHCAAAPIIYFFCNRRLWSRWRSSCRCYFSISFCFIFSTLAGISEYKYFKRTQPYSRSFCFFHSKTGAEGKDSIRCRLLSQELMKKRSILFEKVNAD